MDTEIKENSETEEFLVYVDFEGNLLPNDLDDPNLDVHIIGIDSENPVIEINGKIFEGSYDFSIGTNLFFEKDKNPPLLDPLYDVWPKEMYKFYTKTNKVLKMRRILVESKRTDEIQNKEETFEEIEKRLKPNMSYKEALDLLLPPGMEPPRKLDDETDKCDDSKSIMEKSNEKMEIESESDTDS